MRVSRGHARTANHCSRGPPERISHPHMGRESVGPPRLVCLGQPVGNTFIHFFYPRGPVRTRPVRLGWPVGDALRASLAGRGNSYVHIRTRSTGPPRGLRPLQRGDATGPTRTALPIPGPNLGQDCVGPDAGGQCACPLACVVGLHGSHLDMMRRCWRLHWPQSSSMQRHQCRRRSSDTGR
jgi:hypothetical protein